MIFKCIHCGFYAAKKEENCSYCGLAAPHKSFEISQTSKIIAQIVLTIIFCAAFAVFFYFAERIVTRNFETVLFGLLIAFVPSLFLSHALVRLLSKWLSRVKLFWRQPSGHNYLQARKRIIQTRLDELKQKIYEIDFLIVKTEQNDNQSVEMKERLLSARQTAAQQCAEYFLQMKKIELFRLQNKLIPLLYQARRQSFADTESWLRKISENNIKLNQMRAETSKFFPADSPPNAQSNKDIFFAELAETEAAQLTLRDELLKQQMILSLNNTTLIDEHSVGKDLSEELAIFNIQATLTDFAHRFDRLEIEYQRLLGENKLD